MSAGSPRLFNVCAAPTVGSTAPDFTLPSNTGKDIGLKDLLKKAKHTVLYFYPGKATAVVNACSSPQPLFMVDADPKNVNVVQLCCSEWSISRVRSCPHA